MRAKEKFIPWVIETSAGADRTALAFLLDAYEEIAGGRTTTTTSRQGSGNCLKVFQKSCAGKNRGFAAFQKRRIVIHSQKISPEICESIGPWITMRPPQSAAATGGRMKSGRFSP